MLLGLGALACGATELVQPERILPLRFDSVYVVGAADGNDAEVFTRVSDVRFDDEGRLLVLDGPGARVQVFDIDGGAAEGFGRRGRGPGELQNPVSIAPVPGGVAVLDLGARRIDVLALDGRLRAETPIPEDIEQVRLSEFDGGTLVVPGNGSRFEEPDSLPIYLVHPGDPDPPKVTFRVRNPRSEPEVGPITRRADGGFTMSRRSRASFFPDLLVAVSAGRISTVSGVRYAVELHDTTGSETGRLGLPVVAAPVTEELRARVRTARRNALEERRTGGGRAGFGFRGMTPEEIDAWIENMAFPDTVPAILSLIASPDGVTWVLRSGTDPLHPGPVDLFDPSGRHLATVEVPAFPDALGPGGLVAWIEEDDLGVQRVRVARAIGPPFS